jgi:hypothetical protein
MPAGGDVRWATADDDALLASLGGDPAEVLASSGVERLLSAIDRLNTASLPSARRRGGRAIGSVAMVRILGVSLRREDWFAEVRYRVHRGRRDLVPPPVETARRRPVPVGRG